ncbi:hypothetical protein [Streptomyces sp. NPDC056361]|uniref:hypothetical protein n=1 Tax=Streptomyces sp. NPDC056361 TaxID=3345795 RepID=UPI0035D76922
MPEASDRRTRLVIGGCFWILIGALVLIVGALLLFSAAVSSMVRPVDPKPTATEPAAAVPTAAPSVTREARPTAGSAGPVR